MKSEILNVIQETAQELSSTGLVSLTTMREINGLCLPEVVPFEANHIKAIREKEKVSQAVFAAYLNISPSTVKQWEQGGKKPRGTSLKLLNLVADKGLAALA
jgi:putative transcriptional regulator